MIITHNQAAQRFETTIDGITAYLSYEMLGEQVRDYNHTIVPSALGGRGIGSALVKFALDDARAQGHQVVPSCSFVAAYIARHDAYQSIVANH